MNFLAGAPGIAALVRRVDTNVYTATQAAAPAGLILGDKDMGSVIVGDLCLCMGNAAMTASPALTYCSVAIGNATGTATVVYGTTPVTCTWFPGRLNANETVQTPWFSWGRVTVAGTWIPRFSGTADTNGTVLTVLATLYVLRGA